MTNKNNVIIINGRKYNATTGKLIAKKKSASAPRRVDGFAKPSRKKSSETPSKVLSVKEVKKEVRRRALYAREMHEKQKKSQTLVRSATEKPKKKSFITKIVTPATAVAGQHHENSDSKAEKFASKEPESRLKHAQTIRRSRAISKFTVPGNEKKSKLEKTSKHPVDITSKTTPPQSLKSRLIAEQMAKVPVPAPKHSKNKASRKTAPRKRKPKVATILATTLAALMLFGYITYLNIPNMAMKIAASKAGFEASMPSYNPNGFKFSGPIAYSPGQITIRFSSNTDDRSYDIIERQTAWDSQSLLDNYVAEETGSTTNHSTFRDRGLTIYVYGGSNATWVNGGVWYTINGNSKLNSEQLLKIAASL